MIVSAMVMDILVTTGGVVGEERDKNKGCGFAKKNLQGFPPILKMARGATRQNTTIILERANKVGGLESCAGTPIPTKQRW